MKSAIFIAVRMKSTRLPRKALLEIKGKPVIEHLIERVKTAKLPDLIVLCTSTQPDDAILIDMAKRNNIEGFAGSEDDKLDRFMKAARKYGIDLIVNVDGDDLFCDPIFIDRTIEALRDGADYVIHDKLPLGATCIGIRFEALKKVCEIKLEEDTEVWGRYFTDSGLFKVKYLEPEVEFMHPEIRMTLDYPEDFEFFKAIFDRLYVPGKVFTLGQILTLLESNPGIIGLNKALTEQWRKGFEKKAAKVQWKTAK